MVPFHPLLSFFLLMALAAAWREEAQRAFNPSRLQEKTFLVCKVSHNRLFPTRGRNNFSPFLHAIKCTRGRREEGRKNTLRLFFFYLLPPLRQFSRKAKEEVEEGVLLPLTRVERSLLPSFSPSTSRSVSTKRFWKWEGKEVSKSGEGRRRRELYRQIAKYKCGKVKQRREKTRKAKVEFAEQPKSGSCRSCHNSSAQHLGEKRGER